MSVPKLRFSGFSEKWNKKRLDSFLERVSNPVDVIKEQEYTQIGIRSHGKGIFHKEPINGLGLGNKRVFWVEPNAFVVNIVFAWERAIAVTTEAEKGMIASHRFPMYLPKNNLSNVHFLRYLFVTDKGQSYLELASPGGAGRNKTLGQSNFAELKIDLPSLEEQTKIASFLSAVDEKISQLTQKHELLSQYKQGMMQKLFSQQIRFKADDGSEFGEWEETKIGNVFSVTSGSTPLRSDERFFKDADIDWVKTTDLNNGLIVKTEEKISQIALKETSVKILPRGTVFVAMYGGFNQIGRTGLLVKEAACNQALSAIYPNEKINSYFLLAYLNHKVDDWKNFAASSRKDPNITKSDVLSFPFEHPSDLEEQTKIANFLSAIDQKIEVVAQQIEQAKQWKKGLLQQMFV